MLVEDARSPLVGPSRGRCPVCGHPTGDCAPEGRDSSGLRIIPREEAEPGPDATFVVPHHVYETRQVTPRTTTQVLVAPKGSRITPEAARALGLLDD